MTGAFRKEAKNQGDVLMMEGEIQRAQEGLEMGQGERNEAIRD